MPVGRSVQYPPGSAAPAHGDNKRYIRLGKDSHRRQVQHRASAKTWFLSRLKRNSNQTRVARGRETLRDTVWLPKKRRPGLRGVTEAGTTGLRDTSLCFPLGRSLGVAGRMHSGRPPISRSTRNNMRLFQGRFSTYTVGHSGRTSNRSRTRSIQVTALRVPVVTGARRGHVVGDLLLRRERAFFQISRKDAKAQRNPTWFALRLCVFARDLR
jgi:hypothetical protein